MFIKYDYNIVISDFNYIYEFLTVACISNSCTYLITYHYKNIFLRKLVIYSETTYVI